MVDRVYNRNKINKDAVRTFLETYGRQRKVNLDVDGRTSDFYLRDLAIILTQRFEEGSIDERVALAAYQVVVDATPGISLEEGANHPYRNIGLAARVAQVTSRSGDLRRTRTILGVDLLL